MLDVVKAFRIGQGSCGIRKDNIEQVGHNLWLTQNGHADNFRSWEVNGKKFSKACEELPDRRALESEDGEYIEIHHA